VGKPAARSVSITCEWPRARARKISKVPAQHSSWLDDGLATAAAAAAAAVATAVVAVAVAEGLGLGGSWAAV
jgi:hypothetical protein